MYTFLSHCTSHCINVVGKDNNEMVLGHDRSILQHTIDQTKTIDTIDVSPGPKVFVIDIRQ